MHSHYWARVFILLYHIDVKSQFTLILYRCTFVDKRTLCIIFLFRCKCTSFHMSTVVVICYIRRLIFVKTAWQVTQSSQCLNVETLDLAVNVKCWFIWHHLHCQYKKFILKFFKVSRIPGKLVLPVFRVFFHSIQTYIFN